jgi:putrescine transport system substrate-binding protein
MSSPARPAFGWITFLFINFLNDPKNNAELVNTIYYASANEMARSFIDPQILNNPAIYPQPIEFQNAEFFLPHTRALQALEEEIWGNFTAGK